MTQHLDERLALPLEKAVLLWCMRTWVAGVRQSAGAETRIARMLGQLDAPDASPYLEGFMFAIGHGATRTVAVQCVCRGQVSADEHLLLDGIALAQALRPFEALLRFRGLLSPEAARAALESAEGIGAALARAGRFLPATETEVMRFAFSEPDAGATLH